jgi:hypothetical protein
VHRHAVRSESPAPAQSGCHCCLWALRMALVTLLSPAHIATHLKAPVRRRRLLGAWSVPRVSLVPFSPASRKLSNTVLTAWHADRTRTLVGLLQSQNKVGQLGERQLSGSGHCTHQVDQQGGTGWPQGSLLQNSSRFARANHPSICQQKGLSGHQPLSSLSPYTPHHHHHHAASRAAA